MIIQRVTTPLTRPELRSAIVVGYRGAFGEEPLYTTVGVAWAQLCQEHANGSAIHNNNLGNVDALPDWDGPRFHLTAPEVINGQDVYKTKALCAFGSASEGAEHYWHRLANNYGSALPFFERGDADGAARELKRLRYYTGSVEDYARAMRLLFRDYTRAFPEDS